MSSGHSTPTETALFPYSLRYSFPSARFLCESWWTCWTTPGKRYTWRARADVMLCTDEPISVIPMDAWDSLDFQVMPEPGWSGPIPDWRGIPCNIGRVQMWLPVVGSLTYRPFSLLALLPRQEFPDTLPYLLLGTQFLVEYGATVTLDCSPATVGDRLVIP